MKVKVVCTTILVEKSPQALPLGAACIASALKHSPETKDYCYVELRSFTLEDDSLAGRSNLAAADFVFNELMKEFSEANGGRVNEADVNEANGDRVKGIVCFSIFMWNRLIFETCAALFRKHGIICIAGGPEVTASPDSFSIFDYHVCGQGEISVPYLIGRILREKNEVKNTPVPLGFNSNLKTAPVPIGLSASPYLDGTINLKDYEGVLWELARGCPFKCSYCYESKGEKKVRLIPEERIKKELELFSEKKVSQVFVLDPTYNADKKRALYLIEMIRQYTPQTFYYFEARAEFIDRELALAFTKIPCAIQIGLQSADENVLKNVNRPFNRKKFIKNVSFLNEFGVIFGFDLIYGLPGESYKGFKKGVDFALSMYPNNLEIFCLSVLPGTDLYDKAESLNLVFEHNPPYHIIRSDKISEKELKSAEELAEACCFFYNEGRAVPWFMSICRSLSLSPSAFLDKFAHFMKEKNITHYDSHIEIEKIQLLFIKRLYSERHLEIYAQVASDIIKFHGAISRVQDCGKEEILQLRYPAKFLDSEYAADIDFFAHNVKPKSDRVRVFKRKSYAEWISVRK